MMPGHEADGGAMAMPDRGETWRIAAVSGRWLTGQTLTVGGGATVVV